jgi:hypothetical protein
VQLRVKMLMDMAHENSTSKNGAPPTRAEFAWAVEKWDLSEEEFEGWASEKAWTPFTGNVEGP